MAREQIEFRPGKPELITLKYPTGKRYGERALFTTADERVFYADEDVAQRIEAEIGKGEPFRLGWTRGAKGGREWKIETLGHANGNGTAPPAPQPPPEEPSNGNGKHVTTASAKLMAALCCAIDAAVEASAYAARKGMPLTFSGEDVRTMAATLIISNDRNGGAR